MPEGPQTSSTPPKAEKLEGREAIRAGHIHVPYRWAVDHAPCGAATHTSDGRRAFVVDAPIVSHSIGWSAGTGEPRGGMRFISCLGASIRPRARRPGARGGTGSRRRAKRTSGTEIPLDRSDRDRPSTVPTPGRKLWKTTVSG